MAGASASAVRPSWTWNMSPDEIRKNLSDLASMAGKAARAGEKIATAAAERRDVVDARIAELRPRVLLDEAAAQEYQDLIEERGRIDIVLGQARG